MSAQEAHNATEWGNVAKVFQGNRTATDDYSEEAIKISGMEARKSEPITVFDNGCGGGGTAIIAARLFPNAKVIAGDFAPAMIVATNNRIQQEGLTNITAEVQDGVNLTLESNQFDVRYSNITNN
jgi:ubiquinone/menaquinone biosynthesis C-methylase UbiE